MPDARVTSIETLDAFRTHLLLYLDRAQGVLDDVRHDIVTTRVWLETDRPSHWMRVIRDRTKELAQAEQELLTARLAGHPGPIQERQIIARRARAALETAETGLARTRRWLREYEREVEPRTKAITQLRQLLSADVPKAIAFLEAATNTLAEYAGLTAHPPVSPRPTEADAAHGGSGPKAD